MRPTRQHFQADNLIGDDIDLRLIDDSQFLYLKRVMQVVSDGDFSAEEFIHCLRVEPIGITAVLIGGSECSFRAVQVITGLRERAMKKRDADTRGEANLFSAN